MKRLLLSAMLVGAGASAAFAGPYASQIRISPLSVQQSSFSGISYYLNDDTSATVVEIVDSTTSNVVASFPGATTRGPQSLSWNGTTNNAGGTSVPLGTYRVRIVTAANQNATPTGWRLVYHSRSTGNFGDVANVSNIFNGFSGHEVAHTENTDSDSYGFPYVYSMYGTVAHAAAIRFNPDATVVAPNGFSDRTWKFFSDPTVSAGPILNTGLWGGHPDPDDSDLFFFGGQTGAGSNTTETSLVTFRYSTPNALPVDRDPSDFLTSSTFFPRHIAITKEGANKYVYASAGNALVLKAALIGNTVTTTPTQILGTMTTASLASADIKADAAGNIYWLSRGVSGVGGVLLRWNAAQVAGAVPGTPLTNLNAAWVINVNASLTNLSSLTILKNGDVFISARQSAYFVGNTSSATLTKTLTPADTALPWTALASSTGVAIRGDKFDNIFMTDRSNEQARLYSRVGVSSHSVVAPTSQTFTVVPLVAGASNWQLFE